MSSVGITLNNLKDKEVLHYAILFIRGLVEATDAKHKPLNGKLLLHHDGIVSEIKVSNGKFKCLLELKLGDNNIKINYDDDGYYGECSYSFIRRKNDCLKTVRLFYVIPKNDTQDFQTSILDNLNENACKKITTGFRLLQSFIAERLNEQCFGRKTFKIHGESQSCEIFESKHSEETFHSKTSEEIWTLVAKELLEHQLINEHTKVFAMLSCTEYCKETGEVKGHVACGRGHFAMLGSLGLGSWADDVASIMHRLSSTMSSESSSSSIVGLSETVGECYSSTLGAALHELSHIFDLVHADSGIMARGFEDLDVFFTLNCDNPQRRTVRIEGNCGHGISVKPQTSSKITQFRSGVRVASDDSVAKEGRAFFHRSAVVLLSAHPWFLQPREIETHDKGSIEIAGLQVRAPNGLRLIELHACDDYLVKYWDFTRNPVKLQRHCLTLYDVKNVPDPSLLVQDWTGLIIRQKINATF